MPKRPSDKDALERLDERLDAFESRTRPKPSRFADEGSGAGYRLVAELVSAVLGGLGLGWLADRYLGVTPWGMLGGVLIGAVLGVYLVVQTATKMSAKARAEHGIAPSVPFDDEED